MNFVNNIKFIVKIIFMVFLLSFSCQANFSYTIKSPTSYDAKRYIIHKSNISILSEGSGTVFWHPNVGSSNANSTTPGVIIYHFPLTEPIQEATLFIRTDTYYWDYSRGHSFIFLSTDGNNWDKVTETPPPKFGKWNAGNFSDSLPSEFIGKKDIYIKIMLYSYGSKAFRGGVMTNTAQHLRYDPSHDNITFKLDVKSSTYSGNQQNNSNFNSSNDFDSVLNNISSDENLKVLSLDNYINQKQINNDTTNGDCYVGCKPSSGRYNSCAVSCGNDTHNGTSALFNRGMTSIVTGPATWEACAKSMKKLGIDGW